MKFKINLWAFILSFICVILFFIAISSSKVVYLSTSLLQTHPLNIVLVISIINFIFGLMGFTASTNWKPFFRSVFTVVITLGLCIIIIFITVMANVFKFT